MASNVHRILVAEDDDALRETLTEILTLEGYAVDAAENGLAALEAALDVRPSLLLMDMRMPLMNGWELAEQLRERGLNMPIIVMTASEAASEVAAEIDAADWVGKPYNLEELLRAIRTKLASRLIAGRTFGLTGRYSGSLSRSGTRAYSCSSRSTRYVCEPFRGRNELAETLGSGCGRRRHAAGNGCGIAPPCWL